MEAEGVTSDTDSHYNTEDEEPIPRKKLKLSKGGAKYKTRFQASWRQNWPFVVAVKGDPHSFNCSVCNKVVSCGHQGERDVSRHADTASHKHNLESLKRNQRLSFGPTAESQGAQNKVC